jgi:hypothetical protein
MASFNIKFLAMAPLHRSLLCPYLLFFLIDERRSSLRIAGTHLPQYVTPHPRRLCGFDKNYIVYVLICLVTNKQVAVHTDRPKS